MPKKQPRNSFYFFMVDFKEEQRKKGVVYSNMAEVANAAGPAWASAPPPIRAKYEAKAKEEKQKQNVPEKKFTSTGVSLAYLEQQERERKEAIEAERQDIKNFVMQKSVNKSILNENIFLIDVNYYCKSNGHYLIGECTLLRFSLKEGINSTMLHEIINPGSIPVGYALDVKLGCKEYGLELPDEESKRTNYMQVLAHIIDFLKQQDPSIRTPPPMFTMPDKVEPVQDFVHYMCSRAGEDEGVFRIYKLDTLLYMLANAVAENSNEGFPKESLALVQLKKDTFKYTPGLGCEMHEQGDRSTECSMSRVKRWAYTVMDWCCPLVGIEARPGTHVPPDFDIDSIVEYRVQHGPGPNRVARVASNSVDASADSTLDDSKDYLVNTTTSSVETAKKRVYKSQRMPNDDYSSEYNAPPPLNSSSDFPSLSSSRGRGRGLAGSFGRMKMQ